MKYPQIVSMPSAVSDWLEEQLEARGIDAVVYTRYILSLLHSDAVDVILSEEDQQFSHLKKEVRRSGGGGHIKCFRRSSDWWKYAQAEAEQLKRSAAVECLLSASEQNFDIESLIDELCEKLKEIKSDVQQQQINQKALITKTPQTATIVEKNSVEISELKSVSPQELAKRYYAAFPPLNRNTTNSPNKLISLIPKWINTSPKKTTPPNNNNQNNNNSHNHNNKTIKHHNGSNNRNMKSISRSKRSRNSNYNNNSYTNTNNKRLYNRSKKIGKMEFEKLNDDARIIENDWNYDDDNDDDDNMMYDDLPVDIKELLNDSPVETTVHDDNNVEMMNLANMRDTGKRDFIQCGTNIISSIWSSTENTIDFKLNFNHFDNWSLTIDDDDDDTVGSKQHQQYCTGQNTNNNDNNYWKWSDDIYKQDNQLTLSFLKLNHCKESSPFSEVKPRPLNFNQSFDKLTNFSSPTIPLKTIYNNSGDDKDDLLTSGDSHFKPIVETIKSDKQHNLQIGGGGGVGGGGGQYADGATFVISNNLDKVNYKRSESGAMYLESDYGTRKKYCEYKTTTNTSSSSKNNNNNKMDFILKYIVCQNDKACQTDEEEIEFITNNNNNNKQITTAKCTCPAAINDQAMNLDNCCVLHTSLSPRSSSSSLGDFIWKYDLKSCDKCNVFNNNNNNSNNNKWWNIENGDAEFNDELVVRNIWSGGEVCLSCLRKNGCRPPAKLLEDISQDGDQLLSDLSSLQKTYMEEQMPIEYITDQMHGGCDISEMLIPKRRHSNDRENNALNSCWSFASRLEEDCLIQMSTIPTLRSVTL